MFRDHVGRRRAYRYGRRHRGRRATPVPPVGAADGDPLRAADRDPAGAGRSAVPVPDPGQLHHRRADAEHVDLGPRQFRGGAARAATSSPPRSTRVVFAAASAALALLVGWVTAWIVERTNTPLKPLAYLTAIISLGTPYILYVTAWLLFFGKAGPVNHLYRTLTGNTDVLINIYSMFGMVLVEGFLWSPLAFLLVSATLRNANPELEEAARVHGAGVWADDPARDHAAVAAVDHGAVDAGVHPRRRGVRGAGAGRPAGPHLGADHRHLHQHGGARAARHRRRQRAVGADAAAGVRAALRLRPAVAACRALRHHHRQGLPAAPVRSRAAALRRGRHPRFSISSCCCWCPC